MNTPPSHTSGNGTLTKLTGMPVRKNCCERIGSVRTQRDGFNNWRISHSPSSLRIALVLSLLTATILSCLATSNPIPPPGCSAAQGTCVRIGYFSCYSTAGAECTEVVGYNEMLQWYINRTTTILGVPVYWIEAVEHTLLSVSAAEANATIASAWIGSNASVPLIDFAVLPTGNAWDTGMYLLEQAKIPSVSSLSPSTNLLVCGATDDVVATQLGCTQKNVRRYQYGYSLLNPGEQYLQPWIAQLAVHKAKSLAVVRTPNPFYASIRSGLLTAASDNKIDIVYDQLVPDNADATAAKVISDLRALADEQQPDGFAVITNNCIPWIQAMKAVNYAPNSVAAILCSDGALPLQTLGEDLNYIVGSSQWAPGLSGSDYTENADTQPWALFPHISNGSTVGDPSPLQFQALFQQLIGKPNAIPGYAEAAVLLAPNMLEAAMRLGGSVHPEDVQVQLRYFYQPSWYGALSVNRYGQNNQKQLVINQRDGAGILQITSPISSATADLIYPMPRWNERTYSRHLFATSIERAVLSLVIACCLFTLALMAYIYHHRFADIFHAAGIYLYMTMGFGCLTAYLGVITWSVENSLPMCQARIWLWTVAFLMVVAPILASSYRIATIYANTKYRAGEFTHARVGIICAGLAAPQIIVNCLWAGIAPLQERVFTADLLRPAQTSFTACSQSSAGMVFVGVTVIYCCLLLITAVVLAYRIRNAYAMFNDAQPIAGSIVLFALVASVTLVVEMTLNDPKVSAQKVLFGIRSIGVLLAYQGSIGMLFLRRIVASRQRHSGHGNVALKSALKQSTTPASFNEACLTGSSKDATKNRLAGAGGGVLAQKEQRLSGSQLIRVLEAHHQEMQQHQLQIMHGLGGAGGVMKRSPGVSFQNIVQINGSPSKLPEESTSSGGTSRSHAFYPKTPTDPTGVGREAALKAAAGGAKGREASTSSSAGLEEYQQTVAVVNVDDEDGQGPPEPMPTSAPASRRPSVARLSADDSPSDLSIDRDATHDGARMERGVDGSARAMYQTSSRGPSKRTSGGGHGTHYQYPHVAAPLPEFAFDPHKRGVDLSGVRLHEHTLTSYLRANQLEREYESGRGGFSSSNSPEQKTMRLRVSAQSQRLLRAAAREPLPPESDLTSLTIEDAVDLVVTFHEIIQQQQQELAEAKAEVQLLRQSISPHPIATAGNATTRGLNPVETPESPEEEPQEATYLTVHDYKYKV